MAGGQSVRDMVIRILVDDSGFGSAMDNFDGRLSNISNTMKSVGKQMIAVGATMTGTVAAIGMAGAKWQAEVAGVDFMYKQLGDSVKKSISDGSKQAKSLALTEHQFKKNATEIAIFYKNMGLTEKATADLSNKTLNLAADLGAVKDIPVDEAMRDIKSALVGNYEAVDKYGINLNAATIAESAYVKQLGKKWAELNNAERSQAIYNELTRQGAFANGLATQEATQLNAQFNLAKQQFKETAGAIGQTLIPILTPLIQKFTEVLGKVNEWVKAHPELTKWILIVVAAIGILITIIGAVVAVIGIIIGIVSVWSIVTGVLNAILGVLTAILTILTSPISLVIIAILALIAVFVYLWKTNKGFRDFVIKAWEWIKNAAVATGEAISKAFSAAIEWVVDKFNWLWDKVQAIWGKIKGIWQSIFGGGGSVDVSVNSTTGEVTRNAKGGIFTGFSKMGNNVFGEAGHEAVVPLTAKGIRTFTQGLGMGTGGSTNIFNFDKVDLTSTDSINRLAKAIVDEQQKKERARGQGARF